MGAVLYTGTSRHYYTVQPRSLEWLEDSTHAGMKKAVECSALSGLILDMFQLRRREVAKKYLSTFGWLSAD